MKQGICTNQPSQCRRAAARLLMPMPDPDTRCPEPGCGKPLLPVPVGNRRAGTPSLAAAAALAVLVLAGGSWALYGRIKEPKASGPPLASAGPTASDVAGSSSPAIRASASTASTRATDAEAVDELRPKETTTGSAPESIPVSAQPTTPGTQSKPGTQALGATPKPLATACAVAKWEGATCEQVSGCWKPEDPRLTECDHLGMEACKRIRRCLGLQLQ